MDRMTTSPASAPLTLLTVPDEKNLLAVVDSVGACCGGDSCCIG